MHMVWQRVWFMTCTGLEQLSTEGVKNTLEHTSEIITTPIYNSPSKKPSFVESIRANIRGPRFYAWF